MRALYVLIGIIIFISGCTAGEQATNQTQDELAANEERGESSLLSPDRFLNIAHRGASGHAPEHTINAYQLGEEMNADYIEIDLQMTKDDVLVALHDPNLNRTAQYDGLVSDLTIDEVKQLDVGTWFNDEFPHLADEQFTSLTIPTLDEIIQHFGIDAHYYIETKQPEKDPKMIDKLITVLQKHGLIDPEAKEGHVIIQSFSEESLREVHAIEPSLPLIQLIQYRHHAHITDTELNEIGNYAIGIGVNYNTLSKRFIERVRATGLLFHAYTVNDKSDMERLIDWGVTGIFTDFPDRLNEVLAK